MGNHISSTWARRARDKLQDNEGASLGAAEISSCTLDSRASAGWQFRSRLRALLPALLPAFSRAFATSPQRPRRSALFRTAARVGRGASSRVFLDVARAHRTRPDRIDWRRLLRTNSNFDSAERSAGANSPHGRLS